MSRGPARTRPADIADGSRPPSWRSEEEYPVVLMMCRGSATATVGKNPITPQTCWTQTPAERVQPACQTTRRLATSRSRPTASTCTPRPQTAGRVGGRPGERCPPACSSVRRPGPSTGCRSSPPAGTVQHRPEGLRRAAAGGAEHRERPGAGQHHLRRLRTSAATDRPTFRITTAETNQSLGCSSTVPCALVVIPIMGISCDPAAHSLPPADRPPSDAGRAGLRAVLARAPTPARWARWARRARVARRPWRSAASSGGARRTGRTGSSCRSRSRPRCPRARSPTRRRRCRSTAPT